MKLYQIVCGPIEENCYFLDSENDHRDALIFDPGDNGDVLVEQIKELNLNPIAILLTHAHIDHIGAVDTVRDAFNIPVYQHVLEKDFLSTPELNSPLMTATSPRVTVKPADHLLSDMGPMTIGPFTFTTAHIPGHSPGSIAYIFEEEGFVIAGDTLFNGTVGRTDFPGGSFESLINGIKTHLCVLPDETAIFGGHGEPTVLGNEKATNPYLNGSPAKKF